MAIISLGEAAHELWGVFGAYRKVLAVYGKSEQRRVPHDNAVSIYRQ